MVTPIQEKTAKKRILTIDDGVEITQLISMLLTANGYTVDVAFCGRDGLVHAMKNMPDLILLDFMMPDKDGLEVLQELRQIPGMEDIPVIMLTAQAKSDVIQKALQLNVSDYILKPFELTNLLERIEKLL
ncbi:MAG: response regulator [Anaerolineaceae bacterium]|nr:response regulator [Anaerolineaceae bacterium]